MHCRWGCNQLETRWRIIRDGMKRRSNYLVFIFGRWGRPPDSADIWSPAHLIGHKPSSSGELTEPEPYGAKHEGSAGGWRGVRNRSQGGKIDCAFTVMRRGRSLAKAKKSQRRSGGLCVKRCSGDGGKWHVGEWSCDYRTTDCRRRSSSLHK